MPRKSQLRYQTAHARLILTLLMRWLSMKTGLCSTKRKTTMILIAKSRWEVEKGRNAAKLKSRYSIGVIKSHTWTKNLSYRFSLEDKISLTINKLNQKIMTSWANFLPSLVSLVGPLNALTSEGARLTRIRLKLSKIWRSKSKWCRSITLECLKICTVLNTI